MKNDKFNRLEKIIKWFVGTIGTKKTKPRGIGTETSATVEGAKAPVDTG